MYILFILLECYNGILKGKTVLAEIIGGSRKNATIHRSFKCPIETIGAILYIASYPA